MAKEITIEDLALMVQKGFDEITGKMATKEQVDKKFELVDKRFQRVDNQLEKVEKRLNDVGHKINQIDRRLFSIEEDVAEIKTKHHNEMDRRVTLVERKLGIEAGR
jgi:septation ring formation regulator EzrA